MNAPFNDILHGDSERLEEILENYNMDDQELRAALQNAVGMIQVLQRKVEQLEKRVFPGML